MNPETEFISFDSERAEQPGRHVRQQARLDELGITVDRYGRAHESLTGHFMKGGTLSQENVRDMYRWQEYIVDNLPDRAEQPVSFFDEIFEAQTDTELTQPASANGPSAITGRIKRLLTRSRGELYLLPQTAIQVAARGLARATRNRPEHSKRGRLLAPVFAHAIVVGSILGTAGKVYASSKYGIGGGSFEAHGQLSDVINQHVGSVTLRGSGSGVMTDVLQHKHNLSGPAHHEVATLSYGQSSVGADKHDLSQLPYDPTIQPVQSDPWNQLSNPGKHSISQLPYDPRIQPDHLPHGPVHHGPHNHPPQDHLHTGRLPKEVFVEHGHGITQEYVDIAQHNGFSMSGEEAYRAYNYVNDHVHGRFFTNDQMYRLPNGDWGISHPGVAQWTPAERHWFHQWLVENKKIPA